MSKQSCTLTTSEINHLRRLLGYVRTEIGPSPDELVETVRSIVNTTGSVTASEAQERIRASYDKAVAVPKYVRQAIKILERSLRDNVTSDAGRLP